MSKLHFTKMHGTGNDYVYVKDQDGNVLFGFVYNGTKLVLTDGLEGTYTSTDDELIISGYGTLTYNGMSGTYELLESETNKIGVYVDNKYYEVTLTEDTFVADVLISSDVCVKIPLKCTLVSGILKVKVDTSVCGANVTPLMEAPDN